MSVATAQPEIVTLGCRLNTVESEAMRKAALEAGHADLVIVNTCAVTAEAVRQARQTIRRLARENPSRRIIVTGCAAQTEPETFAGMAEVSQIIGNDVKLKPETWRDRIWRESARPAGDFGLGETERVIVNDIMSVRETAGHLIDGLEGRTRAFVQVQNGCDHRCTFCAIPFGRGNSRSVPAGAVVDRIADLVAGGRREVVLTGVDLTSYGADLPGRPTLGALVERVLTHTQVERLRLSSLDSIEIDGRLFDLLTGEARMLPHVHLSLQAGDDLILKRMKRRHSRAQAVAIVARLKAARPDIAIGADLIAGFPTEDEAMAANTRALIDDCDIVHAHIFPYSPRAGTPAARMPQIEPARVKARAAALRERAAIRRGAWLRTLVGTRQQILVERPGTRGHADNFANVALTTPARNIGDIVTVEIDSVANDMLVGTAR